MRAAWLRFPGQAVLYLAFALVIAYLSVAPVYHPIAPGEAEVRFAVGHQGQRKEACRERTDEELAKLAPNMRVRQVCPRERSPIDVELEMDGRLLYAETVPPTGLSRDGMAYVYRRFGVPAGTHHLTARLRDSVQLQDFNYVHPSEVELGPGDILVIEFNAKEGGFRLSR